MAATDRCPYCGGISHKGVEKETLSNGNKIVVFVCDNKAMCGKTHVATEDKNGNIIARG